MYAPGVSTPRPFRPHRIYWFVGVSIALHLGVLIHGGERWETGDRSQAGTTRIALELAPPQPPRIRASTPPAPVVSTPTPATETAERTAATAVDNTVPTHAQTQQAEPSESGRQAALKSEEALYIETLLRRVERHKYFPEFARRRGQVGTVRVSFEVCADGSVQQVQIEGDSSLFRRVAAEALQASLPFAVPPSQLRLPVQVAYEMQFHLDVASR